MGDLALLSTSSPAAAPAPRAAPALLELRGITKRWRGRPDPVLDGLGLVLGRGSVTWLAGRNGTGKTTLLRIAAGLIGADAGRVRLDGLDPWADRRAYAARVGFLSAGNGGLYARLTVGWHLRWWADIALLDRERRARALRRALRDFELEGLAARRVDRLSMGQRQRLRLAGAFLHEPQVVLLDEPATSLDGEGVALLRRAVQDAVAGGAAVLWCSPAGDQDRLASGTRLLLERGRLVAA